MTIGKSASGRRLRGNVSEDVTGGVTKGRGATGGENVFEGVSAISASGGAIGGENVSEGVSGVVKRRSGGSPDDVTVVGGLPGGLLDVVAGGRM